VVSDVGGVSEAVADGSSGFLVPKGDIAAMSDRLSRLIRAPDLRLKMGTAGRMRYASNFTLDRMLRKTSAVYHMAALGVHAANVLQYSPARISKAPGNS
jgi:glycosyltransferase involved in cell wall biosynthesis